MLLNLSNHPFASWSKEQREQAIMRFESVDDLPFPGVNPYLHSNNLNKLVDEYPRKVISLKPAAVHVMGEMTFTFRLVKALKKRGILCFSSTKERIVTIENNVKTSHFKFVQFRNY